MSDDLQARREAAIDAAITEAEKKIKAILCDLENAIERQIIQVNVDMRNFVHLNTEIIVSEND